MKIRLSLGLFLLLLNVGCFPNVGRTNANLEEGFDIAASGGAVFVEDSSLVDYYDEDPNVGFNVELDLQGAWKNADNSGFAVQGKIPLYYIFTTLDLYYQFPSSKPHFYGIGAELGMLSSIYMAYTYYFNDILYFTLTPRFHVFAGSVEIEIEGQETQENNLSRLWLNPQIAFGVKPRDGLVDISLFAYYNHLLGKGADFNWLCIDNCENDKDYRKQFWYMGVQARF